MRATTDQIRIDRSGGKKKKSERKEEESRRIKETVRNIKNKGQRIEERKVMIFKSNDDIS